MGRLTLQVTTDLLLFERTMVERLLLLKASTRAVCLKFVPYLLLIT